MKVELEKTFPMPAPGDVTWTFLQDIVGVANCMPGAKIVESIDASHHKGTVSVRVGPATMAFRGDIVVKRIDADAHTLQLVGTGSDNTGTSAATMDLTARVEEVGDASQLIGTAVVTMSGKAATFGGRMMMAVADQILKQFADNFAKRVEALAADPEAQAEASGKANEINGIGLAWTAMKSMVRRA